MPEETVETPIAPKAAKPIQRREVTGHGCSSLNVNLRIEALGEPGNGGAHVTYRIMAPKFDERGVLTGLRQMAYLRFQQGNPAGCINGISGEALLAIVADRLEGFQGTEFACKENAAALAKVREALEILDRRTRARIERGVEGTTAV